MIAADAPARVDGRDVKLDLKRVRGQIRTFSETVHRGEATGSTGRVFRHVVVVGIGGSYLGTEFVARALEAFELGADRTRSTKVQVVFD